MNCRYCLCIVGNNYRMSGTIPCDNCGTLIVTDGMSGTYLGRNGKFQHLYRLHPVAYCPTCGIKLNIVQNPCGDSEYENEISKLFGINEYAEAQ